MSEPSKLPDEFYELVDRFLDLADDLHQVWPASRVTHTLMYAAARYSADHWLQRYGDEGEDGEVHPGQDAAAAARAADQYREMFIDNLLDLRRRAP